MTRKKELREEFLQKRNAIPDPERSIRNQQIRQHLETALRKAQRVFAFYPAKGEPDLLPLLYNLQTQGAPLALPAIRNHKMLFHAVTDIARQCKESVFGIPQPEGCLPVLGDFRESDTVLTPGLAFTLNGIRLGYGGGFYDRFLSHFPGRSIAVGYSLQITESLPAFDHDRRVDYICTEEGIRRCSGK